MLLEWINRFPRKAAFALVLAGLCLQAGVQSRLEINKKEIQEDKGFSYFIRISPHGAPFLNASSDTLGSPRRSRTVVFENGKSLPRSHVDREVIQLLGQGRYRHWKKGALYFSSTDGTDPRSNDFSYSVEMELKLPRWIRFIAGGLVFFALLILLYQYQILRSLFRSSAQLFKRMSFTGVKSCFCVFFLITAVVFSSANLCLWRGKAASIYTPSSYGSVLNKQVFYALGPERYDLVFTGDSRTYTNIHPHLIDGVLATQSLNLSGFTNWFATQYPHFQDLVRLKPKDQVVVWSIGHQNFQPSGTIQTQYPIGFRNLLFYAAAGFDLRDLWANLKYFSPFLQLQDQLPPLKTRFDAWRSEVLLQRASETQESSASKVAAQVKDGFPAANYQEMAQKEISLFQQDNVLASYTYNPGRDGDVNSLALLTRQGSYWLVELDYDYFRKRQREMTAPMDPGQVNLTLDKPFTADPRYWKIFTAILDLFKNEGITLIVNEMEEAPHTYVTSEKRVWYRRFMREIVQPEVERRGHRYIRANWDSFNDEDYFDYNHLNAHGAARYSRELAKQLKALKTGKAVS